LAKILAKSGYFDCFCILRTNHPGNQKFAVPFLPGGGRKGRLGASSLSGGLRLTKKSVGGYLPVSLDIVRFDN